jgi:outer membrane protein OmpA-like peptidoglycan-associated protein
MMLTRYASVMAAVLVKPSKRRNRSPMSESCSALPITIHEGQEMPLIRTRNAVFVLGAIFAYSVPAEIGHAETASSAPIVLAQFGPGQQQQQEEDGKRRREQQQRRQEGGGGGGGGRQEEQRGGDQGRRGGGGDEGRRGGGGDEGRRGGDEGRPRFGQQPGGGGGGRPPEDDDQGRRRGGGGGDDNRQRPSFGQQPGGGGGKPQEDDQNRRRVAPGGDDNRQRPSFGQQPGGGGGGKAQDDDPNRRRVAPGGDDNRQRPSLGQQPGGGGGGKPQDDDQNRRRVAPGGDDNRQRPNLGQQPGGGGDNNRPLPNIGQQPGGGGQPSQADDQGRRRDGPGRGDGDRDRQRPGFGQRPGGVGESPDGARRFEAFRPRFNDEDRSRRREERREFSREKLQDVVKQRRERQEGGATVIEEGDKRRIYRGEGGRAFIRHDESTLFTGKGRNFREERGPRGGRRVITERNGISIISVHDENDRLVQRIRKGADGREYVLIDNRERRRHRRGERRSHGGFGFYIDLSPPVIRIPRERYYVYADRASEEEIEDTLSAPPVDDIDPEYTLDEIRSSPRLRERMPSVNLNTITFEFGSWEITDDQINKLEVMAKAIERILRRNPDEVFMIEGHTDAVGSDEDNLSLSDRRAESVARVLTDEFSIPAENLVTQGYGEQYLLIDSQAAERGNRRVEFRRITPLLARGDEPQ